MEKGLLAQALVEDVTDKMVKQTVYLVYDKQRPFYGGLGNLMSIFINKNDAIDFVINYLYSHNTTFNNEITARQSLQNNNKFYYNDLSYIHLRRVPLGIELLEYLR